MEDCNGGHWSDLNARSLDKTPGTRAALEIWKFNLRSGDLGIAI
jgi:hypothetical protein